LNKLAVLAFSLLIFFSTMLWYLANGSLNEYLKSQVELQGHYYSGQTTSVKLANYATNAGIATFQQLSLNNFENTQTPHALEIDEAQVKVSMPQSRHLLTIIDNITINKLTLNVVQNKGEKTNITQLIQQITLQLANDYPEFYPTISAKLYAKKNPELNAQSYAKSHPQAGPIIEHTTPKKKRGKPQQKIAILTINIKTLELNTTQNDVTTSTKKYDVNISSIGNKEGLVINQLGGELLLHLLNLAKQ